MLSTEIITKKGALNMAAIQQNYEGCGEVRGLFLLFLNTTSGKNKRRAIFNQGCRYGIMAALRSQDKYQASQRLAVCG